MYMSACMKYMYHMYEWNLKQSVEVVGFPLTRGIGSFKPWYGHWKLNPDLVQVQKALLIAEPSLWLHMLVSLLSIINKHKCLCCLLFLFSFVWYFCCYCFFLLWLDNFKWLLLSYSIWSSLPVMICTTVLFFLFQYYLSLSSIYFCLIILGFHLFICWFPDYFELSIFPYNSLNHFKTLVLCYFSTSSSLKSTTRILLHSFDRVISLGFYVP